MQEIILSAQDLCKTFKMQDKENIVLDHINVEIYRNDFTIIMEPSGAGKSTLLYALSGMDTISGGTVRLSKETKDLHSMSEKEMAAIRSKQFGFVFQQINLVSNLTIEENILVAGYNKSSKETFLTNQRAYKKNPSVIKERSDKLLKQLNIEKIRGQLPSQVSGGEAQRAAIARALINEPDILFADEPTGSLNRTNTMNILDILNEVHTKGQSILMVTHDMKAAIRGTRILYLSDGKITGELKLQRYQKEEAQPRSEQVNKWLKSLEW